MTLYSPSPLLKSGKTLLKRSLTGQVHDHKGFKPPGYLNLLERENELKFKFKFGICTWLLSTSVRMYCMVITVYSIFILHPQYVRLLSCQNIAKSGIVSLFQCCMSRAEA